MTSYSQFDLRIVCLVMMQVLAQEMSCLHLRSCRDAFQLACLACFLPDSDQGYKPLALTPSPKPDPPQHKIDNLTSATFSRRHAVSHLSQANRELIQNQCGVQRRCCHGLQFAQELFDQHCIPTHHVISGLPYKTWLRDDRQVGGMPFL